VAQYSGKNMKLKLDTGQLTLTQKSEGKVRLEDLGVNAMFSR
jgi:hypothetical protein